MKVGIHILLGLDYFSIQCNEDPKWMLTSAGGAFSDASGQKIIIYHKIGGTIDRGIFVDWRSDATKLPQNNTCHEKDCCMAIRFPADLTGLTCGVDLNQSER